MKNRLLLQLTEKKKKIFILAVIILVGIFLRTYNFHEWLYFTGDQLRDTKVVSGVIEGESPWPAFGPTMRNADVRDDQLFRLGPVHYYFQILSAKIFGNEPDKLAYPDLFFGILAIPLFYFFLRRYFHYSIASFLAGLYSISFFAIQYSRFAWNPNSIPFFILLFLSSLHEILINKEGVRWWWIVGAGAAIGIGIQLHVILLILLPLTAFFVFAYVFRESIQVWKKALVIVFLVLVLNAGQIVSEFESGYQNTRALLGSIASKDPEKKSGYSQQIAANLDCHIGANAHIITSYGRDECDFLLKDAARYFTEGKPIKLSHSVAYWAGTAARIIFFAAGYVMLIFFWRKEADIGKKRFLWLILTFSILSFFVLIPVASLGEFRYYIHIFFLPFLFLGLFAKKNAGRDNKIRPILVRVALLIVVFSNLMAVGRNFIKLNVGQGSDSMAIYLGDLENMADYIEAESRNQKIVYFSAGKKYYATYYRPLRYIMEKKDIRLVTVEEVENIPTGEPAFFMWEEFDGVADGEIKGMAVEMNRDFGQVGIYKLINR